jgi:hypothetical protein
MPLSLTSKEKAMHLIYIASSFTALTSNNRETQLLLENYLNKEKKYILFCLQHLLPSAKRKTYLKESILRTGGGLGISMNKELVKNVIRLCASRSEGTSIADSFVLRSKRRRLIYNKINIKEFNRKS